MNRKRVEASAAALAGFLLAAVAGAQEAPRLLFFTKSSTFIHTTIDRTGDAPSIAGRTLAALGQRFGFAVDESKDGSRIRGDQLARYRAVAFFTTGDLTVAGERGKHLLSGDGEPPVGPQGLADLLAYIERGGGFLGFHSAADTFHGARDGTSPYIAMLGGEFATHGAPFAGTLRIVEPRHPLAAALPAGWRMLEEWYLFDHLDQVNIHVLALLDPGREGHEQAVYQRAPYPVVWIKRHGRGRVYYNALGHSPHVWEAPEFQQAVADAVWWAMGRGEDGVVPNFALVVPTPSP